MILMTPFLILLLKGIQPVFSQEKMVKCPQEDTLLVLRNQISANIPDSLKLKYNFRFIELLRECLMSPDAISYSFDSLKFLSVLTHEKHHVRLITWQLEMSGPEYCYFGLFSYQSGSKSVVVSLSDTTIHRKPDEKAVYEKRDWYGAVYYDLNVTRRMNSTVVTLLGRRNLTGRISRKIIDFASINEAGDLLFGNRNMLIMNHQNEIARLFFDYPSEIPLTLKFEDTRYVKGKPKKQKLIVFHRLTRQDYFDQYNMPVPDYEFFDGFVFQEGHWQFIQDVDLRTRSSGLPEKKRREKNTDLFGPLK